VHGVANQFADKYNHSALTAVTSRRTNCTASSSYWLTTVNAAADTNLSCERGVAPSGVAETQQS